MGTRGKKKPRPLFILRAQSGLLLRAQAVLMVLCVGILLFTFYFLLSPQAVEAAIPKYINFQGRLTDSDGTPVADGSYSATFRLYSSETGGTAIWTETQSVTTSNGVFNVAMGTTTSLSGLAFDTEYWLSVQIGSDTEMSPRQRLTAAGYSINADNIDSYTSSQFLRSDADDTSSGQLTLTYPGTALIVQPSSAPDANSKLVNVKNTGGTSKFSVDYEGDVSSQNATVGGALAVTGTTTLTGATTINNALTVGEDGTGYDVKLFGATSDNYLLWDESEDKLIITGDVQFTGTVTGDNDTGTTYTAGEGIDIDGSNVISGEDATSGNKGIASFNTGDFAVASGDVTVKSDGIDATEIDWGSTGDKVDYSDIPSGNIATAGSVTIGTDGWAAEDVKFFGSTSGCYLLWDGSGDDLVFTGTTDLKFDTVTWNTGNNIDGEQIADDTIDDDSLDLGDITLADFTDDVGFLTSYTETDPTLINDAAVIIGNASGDTTLTFNGDDGDVDGTIVWDITDNDWNFAHNLDLAGDIDVNGTANLDEVDIDGAVQIDEAVTVGTNAWAAEDVKFFGTTTGKYLLWDGSADSLKLVGDSAKAYFGAGEDASIYYDGSDLIIKPDDVGDGAVKFLLGASAETGLYFDQSTTAYTGTASTNYGVRIGKTVATPASSQCLTSYGLQNTMTNSHVINDPGVGSILNYGTYNGCTANAAHSTTPEGTLDETNYGVYNRAYRSGTLTSTNTSISNYANYSIASDGTNYNSDGNTLTVDNYGGYFYVIQTGNSIAGEFTKTNYGVYSNVFGTTTDTTTNYGLYATVTGADTNYAAWFNGGDVVMDDDSKKLYLGEGQDASLTFDGSTLVIDPNEVTSTDSVNIDGDLTVGVDDTGYDVTFYGATSGCYILWDESEDDLSFVGTTTLTLPQSADVSGNTGEGQISWDTDGDTLYVGDGAAVVEIGAGGGATAWNDIGDPDNDGLTTIDFDHASENTVFTNIYDAAGSFLKIDNTDADLANNTYLLDLEYTDDGQANADFFKCSDNNGDVKFSIQEEGNTAIAGAITGTKVNPANGSAKALTLSGTLNAFNGGDTFAGLFIDYTNADHSAISTNYFLGIDIAGITADDQAVEHAIRIQSGWDWGIYDQSGIYSTGAVDFGDASLEIPNSADPDVDAAGELSADTDDHSLRGYDGSNQFVYGRKQFEIDKTILVPKHMDEAATLPLWKNKTGFTFNITAIYSDSDTDNVVFTLKECPDTDYTSLTTIEAVTIATDGTGVFYDDLTSGIDHTAIENDNVIVLDNDSADDPAYVHVLIVGYFDADVN